MSKQDLRDEIQQATATFEANGGEITYRREAKAMITCQVCRHRRYVSVKYAMTFGRACIKCGHPTSVEWMPCHERWTTRRARGRVPDPLNAP
jgi:hypothetical protein